MHVLTKYLDTRNATIAALEDYPLMAQIITASTNHTHDTLKNQVIDHTLSPRTPVSSAPADAHFDFYSERHYQACQYMDWFMPAWKVLSENERYVLETFFLADGTQEENVRKIGERFYIERDSVYRRKNRALKKLSMALFGLPNWQTL